MRYAFTSQRYYAFYIRGLAFDQKPGPTNLIVTSRFLKMKNQKILWRDIKNVDIKHEVVEKSTSVGGAVVGGIIAGGVGAVIGGMSGGKAVNSYIVITYTLDEHDYSLVMQSRQADAIIKNLRKRLTKYRSNELNSNVAKSTPAKPKRSLLQWYFLPYTWIWGKITKSRRND